MASSTDLEERFNVAVKTIQNLPPNGIIQPSNLTKLTFYGLYKQATHGPCNESRPSVFNIVGRAKWEAWDRCRSMTKEQAMSAYIGEIAKIVETMPQTNEVLEFAKSMGLPTKSMCEPCPTISKEKQQHQIQPLNNLITNNNENEDRVSKISSPVITDENEPLASPTSFFSSSIGSSDIEEFYDDPSCYISSNYDDTISDYNIIEQPSLNEKKSSARKHVNQNRTNNSIQSISRHDNSHVRTSTVESSNENFYSISSAVSDISNRHHSTNDYNKETQGVILAALNKLQRNINDILERLNRLETATNLLQQKALSTTLESNSSSRWSPLAGLRRRAAIFILLWPFIVFILMRLLVRARISIRFRRKHL